MIDTEGTFFCNDTGRIIVGEQLYHVLGILNSRIFFFAIKHYYGGGQLGEHGVRMKHTFFEQFPCIPYCERIAVLSKSLSEQNDSILSDALEELIAAQYNLSDQEMTFIYHSLNQ